MKLFKSLLLGSAAGLVAVSGASAADLGVKKPSAAVEYVRVCSAHGAGFWYIPGSDVCIKIGGRVRAEYLATKTYVRGDDVSSFRANGRLEADLRQTTSYGLLRAFVRYDVYADGGRYQGNAVRGTAAVPAGYYADQAAYDKAAATAALANNRGLYYANNQYSNPQNTNAFLDKAFIQFYTGSLGFFTAGRSVSFFDFYANDTNWGRLPGSDRGSVNLFAYTFTFGGGLTATVSVEDNYARRIDNVAAVPQYNYTTGKTYVIPASNSVQTLRYSGQRSPDIVGNLRVDQSWGSAQLSMAAHQAYLANWYGYNTDGTYNTGTATGANYYVGNKWGWAIQGGLKLNLPMIAAGDVFWLQAAYSKGASDYAGVTRYANDAAPFGAARGAVANADGYVIGSSTKLASSWSITSSFVHNFTPTIQGALYGGYGGVNYASKSMYVGYNDYKAWAIGGQLSWLPVKGMRIGGEVMYNVLNPKGAVSFWKTNSAGIPTEVAKKSFSGVTARLRFQRDF